MTTISELLQKTLIANQHQVAEEVQQKMVHYLELLQQWNKVYNLTAIRDEEEAVYLHILDSLTILPYLHGERMLDVGTGAGLPGIPLALMVPDKQFVLLDSNNKKTRFLNQVVYDLGLKNVTVVHERCERFHPEACFDSIMSRAFASLKDMLLSTQHLLCAHGKFIAMKGVYPELEISEMPGEFELQAVHQLKIQGLDVERHAVCILKRE